ncbi:hypothetical protein Tco_0744556 [Tanacetum coccineum]
MKLSSIGYTTRESVVLGFKTSEDYKDDWIYEWNEDVPWVHERPWTDNGAWEEPTPVRCNIPNLGRSEMLNIQGRYFIVQ